MKRSLPIPPPHSGGRAIGLGLRVRSASQQAATASGHLTEPWDSAAMQDHRADTQDLPCPTPLVPRGCSRVLGAGRLRQQCRADQPHRWPRQCAAGGQQRSCSLEQRRASLAATSLPSALHGCAQSSRHAEQHPPCSGTLPLFSKQCDPNRASGKRCPVSVCAWGPASWPVPRSA